MQVRKEQADALNEGRKKVFEDRMVGHVRQAFPLEFSDLGEDTVRQDIRYGIDRAEAHEIFAERQVAEYIDFMFILGRDFDTEIPAARRILEGVEFPAVERLCKIGFMASEEKIRRQQQRA